MTLHPPGLGNRELATFTEANLQPFTLPTRPARWATHPARTLIGTKKDGPLPLQVVSAQHSPIESERLQSLRYL
jgi:hypothetical protein